MHSVLKCQSRISNLIANAIKFTDRGEVVVSAWCETQVPTELLKADKVTSDKMNSNKVNSNKVNSNKVNSNKVSDEKVSLHFSVRDTGIGIATQYQPHLFQSFSQVDTSLTRRHSGTGLGLAISKRLVEMMGGTLWLESDEGSGSTFHFTISTKAVQSSATMPSETSINPFVGKHVLIVDDNATACHTLSQYVERWGLKPTPATSIQTATTELSRNRSYDLLIVDTQMPETTGQPFVTQLRNLTPPLVTPIILLSAVGEVINSAQVQAWSQAFTIVKIVSKPVKHSDLYNAILNTFVKRDAVPVLPQPSNFEHLKSSLPPAKILLVEDNVINQKVALRILQRLGYQADVAVDGEEAVLSVQRLHYDVVLMDAHMPKLDGVEATRRIRALSLAHQQPYIIGLTADAMVGFREACLQAGMNDYITKPMQIEALVAALGRSTT